MQFGAWDKFFNLVLLVLWFAIWHGDERRVMFNPYLAPIVLWNRKLTDYLKPVLFGLNERAVAGIAFGVLLLLRALAAMSGAQWILTMGFFRAQPAPSNILSFLLFSVISFAIFLFKIWGICMIYVHGRKTAAFRNNTGEALHEISSPFADLRIENRPPALLGYGIALAYLMTVVGTVAGPGNNMWLPAGPIFLSLVRCFLSALAAWTSVLLVIRTMMIILIIGSWISMFTQSHALMLFSRDWLDFIIGPLRRYPLRIGPIDLTPIVMIFGLEILHNSLMYFLERSYLNLL